MKKKRKPKKKNQKIEKTEIIENEKELTKDSETEEQPKEVKKKNKKEKKEEKKIKKTKKKRKKSSLTLALEICALLISLAIIVFLFLPKKAGNVSNSPLKKTSTSENFSKKTKESREEKLETKEVEEIPEKIDSSNWQKYTNKYYGFEIKYNPNWNQVQTEKINQEKNWVARFNFRKKETTENDNYLGFDVSLYDIQKTKELKETEEFPKIKEATDLNAKVCETIGNHLKENSGYSAEEIFIPPNNNCYESSLFYTLTGENYTYTISPVFKNIPGKEIDLKKQILKDFPEFFASAATFNLIEIQRAKPIVKPRTPSAPKPVFYAKVGGRMVCNKKNDHPKKSKQNKKRHLDMECCLDPDEYPNPWCSYDSNKYGKYLK